METIIKRIFFTLSISLLYCVMWEIFEKIFYQMCRKTPYFSYGDIRHVYRICADHENEYVHP